MPGRRRGRGRIGIVTLASPQDFRARLAAANGVEAGGAVTLTVGGEPTGEDVASMTSLRDVDTNLTVDFGLVPADRAGGRWTRANSGKT